MKKFILSCIALFLAFISFGQTVNFKVTVDKEKLNQGDIFEIRYETNQAQAKFEEPDFSGYQIISGPNVSKSTSVINGNIKQEASYSFRLMAIEKGNQIILPAKLIFNGEEYTSGEIKMEVKENPEFDYENAIKNKGTMFFHGLEKPKDSKTKQPKLYKI